MECKLSLRGIHNVSNACSAAAVGYLAGMSLEEIVAALEASMPEGGRQEICVGELARLIGQAARSAGFAPERIHVVDTREEALAFLREYIAPGDTLLLKASHFMELDRIAKELLS